MIENVRLFGGYLSKSYFNIWLARSQDTQEAFGVALLELPYWLYMDFITLKQDLAWHRKDIKQPKSAGFPHWEEMNG